ncbi:MAG TPA: RAMP superfamily CRISPR-associated protein [Caldilineaceae bacterium]|nr:RAMP superfamily CRISPR-associated protein [Caldilineaceae bacterium]
MQYDYYAFQQTQLSNSLSKLEQAAAKLEQARRQRDRNVRQQAEGNVKQAAREAVQLEPHLAYLWFEARASELDNSIRDTWQKRLAVSQLPEAFRFTPDLSALGYMPPLSFMLRIPFRLQKPYISKDESVFYLLDNPLRKEKIFQAPMVAATSWKGALRAALWQLGNTETSEVVVRLLGNPRGSDEHQAGRLYFYPTFFERVGLEVINPHSRETGVGERGPILIECVPEGTTGTLLLLYVPFGPIESGEQERRAEVAQDLEALAEGVQALLTVYGFGAKTSSGFGMADDRLAAEGTLVLRAELPGLTVTGAVAPQPEPVPNLPRYLESSVRLHADFRRTDGSLKSAAEYEAFVKSRGEQYGKKERQLYEKAQKWWEREGRQLAEATAQEPEAEPAPTSPPQPRLTELTFATLSELREVAQHMAAQLRNGDEA